MNVKTIDSLIYLPKILYKNQFYNRSQFFSKKEIIDYQNKKLKKIVQYASQHVPYYKKLFSDNKINIDTFSGIDDLHRIPLLDKETLRLRKEEFISDQAKKSDLKWASTSGSTGTPLKVILDNKTIINKYSATYRAYHWAGYNLGDRMFKITDVSPDFETIYSLERSPRSINFFSNQVSEENSLIVNEVLWKFKPKIFLGYCLSFLVMGKFLREAGKKIYSPAAIINYGESISKNVIKQIEELYHTKFYDYYSHKEGVVLINQCTKGKLHVAEDYAYHEVIDENGKNIEEGSGELTGTGFYNYVMPLIRYKTRDIVELQKRPCNCGRSSRIISDIIGRRDDFIITPEGKYLFLPEGAISYSKNVVYSQYVQETTDQLTINLVVDEKFTDSELSGIETGLRERFGNIMKFNFKIVDELEKTRAGKTKFIISRMGNVLE